MNKNTVSRPLYLQIQDTLLEEMAGEAYGLDGKLPSERELAERFAVSRMTARQALQSLQQRGLTYTQAGKGTYVKRLPVQQPLGKLSSFTADMHDLGIVPHSRVLGAGLILADALIAQKLQVAVQSSVVYLKRLRIANQQPLAIETAHISHVRVPGILSRHDFSRESLYHVLEHDYGLSLAYAEQAIRADVADVEERHLLHMEEATPGPVLRINRVTFDAANAPLEYVSSVYHGAYYEFCVSLRAARAQIVMPGADVSGAL
jgi:GntR family transcriptional regulator